MGDIEKKRADEILRAAGLRGEDSSGSIGNYKPMWTSKTLLANLAALLFIILNNRLKLGISAEEITLGLAALNIILRFESRKKIGVHRKRKSAPKPF